MRVSISFGLYNNQASTNQNYHQFELTNLTKTKLLFQNSLDLPRATQTKTQKIMNKPFKITSQINISSVFLKLRIQQNQAFAFVKKLICRQVFNFPKFLLLTSIATILLHYECYSKAIYGGVDMQYQSMTIGKNNPALSDGTLVNDIVRDQYPHENLSPNFFLGFDDQKHLKIEANYSSGDDSKTSDSTGIGANSKGDLGKYGTKTYPNKYSTYNKIEVESYSIDFKPYAMLDDITAFYAIIGIGKYQVSVAERGSFTLNGKQQIAIRNSKASKIAPSLGIGLEFRLFDSIFARTQIKYTALDTEVNTGGMAGKILFQNMLSANVGVGYSFKL